MAIYHLSVKVVSRGGGRSCVAAAAYRSGSRLADERQGLTHDYTRRHDVRETWIQAPENAPAWLTTDRQALWTAVDATEKRKDAQTAREVELSLPRELTPDQQRQAVQEFVEAAFVERGMVADVAIHEGHDPTEPNPHAHILLTTRTLTPDGFGPKNRDWNAKDLLVTWRTQWEITCNEALVEAGQTVQLDARSLTAQGIDRLPTVHEGPAVRQMEQRGLATERGDWNRAAAAQRRVVVELAEVRAEKTAALTLEQTIRESAAERQAAGWTDAQLAAVRRLEEQLGRPLDAAYLRRQRDAMAQKQHAARARMAVIDQAGKRLAAAAAALTRRDQAQAEQAGWETWAGRLRRMLSPAARKAYGHVREARRRAEETQRYIAPDLATWPALEAERAQQRVREAELPLLKDTVQRQEWTGHRTWAQALAGFDAAERRAASTTRVAGAMSEEAPSTPESAPYRHVAPGGIEIVYVGAAKPPSRVKPPERTPEAEPDRGYSR